MKDIEFLPPLTPEQVPASDDYVGAFLQAETGTYFDELKIRLDFELLEPPLCRGLIISLFCPYPTRDRNRRPSRRSKFYQVWVFANGGPPRRGERMWMTVFKGYWKLRIRWGLVKGEPSTPVVDALLERVAGGAR